MLPRPPRSATTEAARDHTIRFRAETRATIAVMHGLSEGDAEADLVRQLKELAGAAKDASSFAITLPGGPTINVHYDSGSGSNVSFRTTYGAGSAPSQGSDQGAYRGSNRGPRRARRPMRITLRRETSEEVDAKQRGISREFQSGDAAFDRDVYVDTATDDEVLRYVLASPALRASVLALLDEGVRAVELDDVKGEINASLYSFAHAKHDPARARRIVEAFDRVARGAPPVEHSNEPRPRDTESLLITVATVMAVGGFTLGIPLYLSLVPNRCWIATGDGEGASLNCQLQGCCDYIGRGAVLGVVLGLLLSFMVPRWIRGRSDSHKRRMIASASVGVVAFELSLLGASLWTWYR